MISHRLQVILSGVLFFEVGPWFHGEGVSKSNWLFFSPPERLSAL
jgi:hypothetical protein